MNLTNIINKILSPHQYNENERLLREKITTINIVIIVMGTILIYFTTIRFLQNNYIQAIADLVLLIVMCISYFVLHKDKTKIRIISRILIVFAIIVTTILIAFSPEISTRFAWVSVTAYMMFFLLDLKEGIIWFFVMLLTTVILYLTDILALSISEFIIFFVSTSLLALMLSRYEKIKQDSERHFEMHAKELKKAVAEKTNELQAQKDMFESLFQKSYDGLLLIENKKFIECNDSILKMLGYSKKEDLLNTHPSKLSPVYQSDGKLSIEKADEMINECMEKGSNNFEWIYKKANGEIFWCDVTLTRLKLHEKDLIHAVWRDISDKKALEIENKKINENLENEVEKRTHDLEIAIRAKTDFLANMSHEIRTPLNAILGFIDILKKDETDEKREKYLNIIHTSGQGLLTVINDILDFSKIESGKLELEMAPFELLKPFEEVQLLFFEKAKEKDITINIHVDSDLPESVLGDTVRIKQIISNLVSNAIKFTPEHGSISINLYYEYENSMLSCSVVDSGIGISDKNLKTIFSSFTQADSSTTRNFGGTGLGLSISKRLIELMKGNINVKSEINKGSTFYFNILLKPTTKTITILEEESSDANTKLQGRVLIVEDNKTNQMLIKIMLDELGLRHSTVQNGLEAVEQVQKENYDLILMDENMPIMNGIEATKKIRSLNLAVQTPIVAVTANAIKGDRKKFIDAGMNDYLSKPIDNNEFINIIKKYLKPLN